MFDKIDIDAGADSAAENMSAQNPVRESNDFESTDIDKIFGQNVWRPGSSGPARASF